MILKYTILCFACCVCELLADNIPKKPQPEIFQGDKAVAKIREFMTNDWGLQTWQIEKKPLNGISSDPPIWHVKGTTWMVRIIGPEHLKGNLDLDKLDPKLTYEFTGMPVDHDCGAITLYATRGIQKLEEQKLEAKAEQAIANPLLTLPQELIGRHNGAMGQFGQATKDKPLSFGDDDITLGGIELKADGELIVPFALKGESFKNLSFKFHENDVSGAVAVWHHLQVGNDRYSATLFRYGSAFRVLVKLQREDGSVAAIQWICAESRKAQAGTGRPATHPESKSEGSDKPQPEAEVTNKAALDNSFPSGHAIEVNSKVVEFKIPEVPIEVVSQIPDRAKKLRSSISESAVFEALGLTPYRDLLSGFGGGPTTSSWVTYQFRPDRRLMLTFDRSQSSREKFIRADFAGDGWKQTQQK